MVDESQREIIALLYKQEMLLAKLYQLFAGQFPEQAGFWESLSKEELTHASWIKQLLEAEQKGIVSFQNDKLNAKALKTYIAHLEKAVEKANAGGFTARSALAYTLDFERSLVEKKAFTGFKGITKKADVVLDRLHQETQRHAQKVEEMMKQG